MVHKFVLTAALSLALIAPCANAYTPGVTRYTNAWGTHTSINLYHCAPSSIRSQVEIERFMSNLCSRLGLTRHGKTQFLYHYAGNGYTSGLTAMQLANGHTDIVLRVDELNNDVYLDFFSCMPHDSYDIARRAQDFFNAYDMTYEYVNR